MDVVTIGHTSIDRVKIKDRDKTQLGGGAVYSAMAAKIFSTVGIVSRVGDDFPGRFYSVLRKSGINTDGLKKVRGKSTSFSIDYDKDGVANYKGYALNAGTYIRPEDVPKTYLGSKGFHIAPMAATKQRILLDYLREKTDRADETDGTDGTGCTISLNTHIGYFPKYRKKILDLISRVDIFTINDEEAICLTGTRRLEYALNALKKTKHNMIAVTIGVIGSMIIDKEMTFFPSVYQPKIVDLTGCGDAFAGAFISSFVKTGDPLKSANIANSVASIAATGWNFKTIKNLRYESIENFQKFVVSRQKMAGRKQRSIDYFY